MVQQRKMLLVDRSVLTIAEREVGCACKGAFTAFVQ